MNKRNLNFLITLLLVPIITIGQIPKGHFIDADKATEKGYVVKPFKQEKEGIYHYAVLTELPFENDCTNRLSEKEQIACAEKKLRKLIYEKLTSENTFKGNVYVYLSVTKDAEITDVSINSYPKSKEIEELIKEAISKIEIKAGKFNNEIVISRLWTSFTFPSSSKELLSESLEKMKADKNAEYKKYENLIFDATQYIFSNPIYPNGKEFQAANKIIGFWKNKDTGLNIPIGNDFYNVLTNKNQQQYLYMVGMMNHSLNQKINHKRILACKPIEGQKYKEQKDVQEVQLEGAKILLKFIGNSKNNVPMNSKTKKYYKAFEKNKLNEKLFN
ncbi:hypothetical protein L3X37_02700 [Sabulilitoribacter arenilitoris]|uniref:Uncharacterized protein n=1 Tax=Wocania arenilitoris TaxID=2044858 RepID=A0AAE3EL02_9FLAO|nr:hypothetical protein [Wocania arenilitoris]MCF7567275.1 hypothetical protein [Wocania arenilitoris]